MAPAAPHRFSRPVFDQSFTVHSDHAQRLLDRGFHLVVRALYGIDVVLRILGDEAEMDEVEGVVSELIGALSAELAAEAARLERLREQHGIQSLPRYTNPQPVKVSIPTPQVAQYTALIQALDGLMVTMDTLWLTGVLSNKQRARGAYDWRIRLLRTGRRIIEIERRARASAVKRGKGDELPPAAGDADGEGAGSEAAGAPGAVSTADTDPDLADAGAAEGLRLAEGDPGAVQI